MKTSTTKTRIALGIGSLIALNLAPLHAATYSVGDGYFGANLTGTAYATGGYGTCDVNVSGRANATLFFKSLDLASGESTLHFDGPTKKVTNSGSLTACGKKTLVNWGTKPADNGNFYTSPLFSYLPGGSCTFMVGPVPVTVQAGAWIVASAVGRAETTISNGQPVVTASFGPQLSAGAAASVGIGVVVASAGVEGSITLCELGLADTVKIYPASSFAVNSVDLNYTTPSGKISLYAQIGYGWFSWRPTKEICSFKGSTLTSPLLRNAFSF